MNSSQLLQQAKEIIANLQERKENQESSIKKLNNNLLKNTANTESPYCIGSDTLHKYESKEEIASNKYEEIRNIINNLSEKKVQKFNDDISVNTIIDNLAEQNTSNTSNFADSCMKKVTENVLNDSGEIVSKASVSYLKKSNNKRFKLKHSSNSKQLHLTEFYNVVKSVRNNDANSENTNEFQSKRIISNPMSTAKSENQVDESRLQQKSSILNNTTDFNENKTVYTPVTRKKDYVPHLQKNNSKSEEKGVWDLFNSVKKNNEGRLFAKTNTNTETVAAHKFKQIDRVHIQKERSLKETVSKNSSKSTIDDFCNNITTNNKLKDYKLNTLNYSPSKENSFVKSFSTGNTISEKENDKYTNSVPVTNYELMNVKKRLEGNITFDDFFESAVKSINSKNGDNSKSKTDVTEVDDIHEEQNGCNEMKKHQSEETILSISSKQSDCNKKIQVSPREKSHYSVYNMEKCYNSELDTAVKLIDENMDLSYQNNYHQFNQSSDDHKNLEKSNSKTISQEIDTFWSQYIYQCTDGERSECTSQINQPDLISEDGNGIIKDKRLTAEEENSNENFYHCVGNCSENEANVENCLESQINLLDNDLEKSILTAAYRKKKTREKTEENAEPFNLENFLENVILNNERKTTASYKCNLKIKRYRKGKTKIYKLKRLKKRSIETEELNEDLNLPDLLKKIATENLESQPRLSRFKSGSSISTSSSYIADDTKSDVLSTGSRELTSPQQRLRFGFNELSKDDSLLYSANEWEEISEHDKEDIKMKIQDLFFQILEDFKNKRSSYFRHRRQSFDNCIFKDGRLQFKPATESSMTVISSKAQKSKAKFQLMLHILKKIQTLLETGTKLTKRELYYQLKELISDQRATDRSINAISCLLNVGMWALNIIAQKGLVFGDLKLLLSSGEMLNCNVPGTLIPRDINDIAEVHSTAYFILVVEKESIFHKLIEEDLPNKLTRPFIMITGKGFPDLNTQLFLRKLWMVMSIPVFILVDADPHGINIMLNYRFGSVNNAHVSQHLAVPNAKWLGVYPSEITNLNIAREPLNEREIKLVNRMLATPYMEFSPKLVEELRVLLTKKFKAGIEGLMKTDSYLSEVYLPNKFFTHNFI